MKKAKQKGDGAMKKAKQKGGAFESFVKKHLTILITF